MLGVENSYTSGWSPAGKTAAQTAAENAAKTAELQHRKDLQIMEILNKVCEKL